MKNNHSLQKEKLNTLIAESKWFSIFGHSDIGVQPHFVYYLLYGKIPDAYGYSDIEAKIVLQLIKDAGISDDTLLFSSDELHWKDSKEVPAQRVYHPHQGVIVQFTNRGYRDCLLEILFSAETDRAYLDALKDKLRESLAVIAATKKHCIHILHREDQELLFREMPLQNSPTDLQLNYNDDLQPVHDVIFDRLQLSNDKGLVILHGKPGTGKTTYIRHLSAVLNKKLLFVPPSLANHIADPEFMSLLQNYSNSVMIVEDAEDIVRKREGRNSSAVSNLLSLSDGLLADAYNIQIVCSFNTDLARVDEALLRKGRLIAQYEFLPLDTSKAIKLLKHLGQEHTSKGPMTLAEIYHLEQRNFEEPPRKAIGFKPGKSK